MIPSSLSSTAAAFMEANLRRFAARATRHIALRRGRLLDMSIGCGYPKSGTVWLCQLMASYLGAPYPQNYYSPIAMRSVVHAHWRWDARLPPTAYIVRDGRDVMVSFYFFHMRTLQQSRDPSLRFRLSRKYSRLLGTRFDPMDIRSNLPRFIESTMTEGPATRGMPWHAHVRDWTENDHKNVAIVRYEDLLHDTATELAELMARLTKSEPNLRRAELAAARYSFQETTGRIGGLEDRSSFHRKGIAGDWKNHFTLEAGEVFDTYAGDVLMHLGYAGNRDWYRGLVVGP